MPITEVRHESVKPVRKGEAMIYIVKEGSNFP
jgi:hypothetical protein